MKIDIFTFAIVLGITHSIQFIIFLLEYFYHKNYKGPGWWLLWSSSAVLGFLFLVARRFESFEHIFILLQNLMLITSSMFLYIGIMRFWDHKERLILLILILLLFIAPFIYFTFFLDSIQIRTILLWSSVSAIASISAFDLYNIKRDSANIALTICTLVFLFHALFSAIKVIYLLTGSQIVSLTSQLPINTSTYAEVLIISLFWTYALIMMINHRLTVETERAKVRFEVIYNTSPDAILITSMEEGTITSVNDKFYELSGYTAGETLGKTTTEIKLWNEDSDRSGYISLLSKQGYFLNFEASFRRKDRQMITGLISSKIIKLGEKNHLMTIFRDISERKKGEEEILAQNLQLQVLNAEKDKFFSIIAHDLKSPLSSFLGLTEIMADEIHNLPFTEVIQLSSKMRDSASNLFGLLNNLLEWSIIKRGVSSFNPQTMSLFPEVQESTLTFFDLAQKKQISVFQNISAEEMVFADRNMLRSMIRNLLSNAIKFTPNGGSVTISSKTLDDRSSLISVHDTGIGMNKLIKDSLFKIDETNSRKGTNGELSSGLGLLLCKEFVTRHDGIIWVESTEGVGSTFYIKLPPEASQT
jgi:PAS domain S-box-containing protein